jgi:hypothetical protein
MHPKKQKVTCLICEEGSQSPLTSATAFSTFSSSANLAAAVISFARTAASLSAFAIQNFP